MSNCNLNIIADENMIGVSELFKRFGTISFLPGRDITTEDLKSADVLLVRSVTRVNKDLLEGTSVRFVGSATIGVDHVDQTYLKHAGIRFVHAPGCNAAAVVQYVLSAVCQLCPGWEASTVGIVGCGNVGNLLRKILLSLNVKCRVYDPFISSLDGGRLSTLGEVIESDIVTVHTPLTFDGPHPTQKMINHNVLKLMKDDALLINSGRGEVIDAEALLGRLQSGRPLKVALDVWQSEPNMDTQLMELINIATPHIAGYSIDGKRAGTDMIYKGFLSWMGLSTNGNNVDFELRSIYLDGVSKLDDFILKCYDIEKDDKAMRSLVKEFSIASRPVAEAFDQLRRLYPERRDFRGIKVSEDKDEMGKQLMRRILALGVSV
jgi:erythronate-4-phosphate dehydrogenase